MRRWTLVLATCGAEASIERWLSAAKGLVDASVTSSIAARAGEDRKGLGELIWTMTLPAGSRPTSVASVAELLKPDGPVRLVDEVEVGPIASEVRPLDGPRVLRTLLIRVRPGTPSHLIEGLESALVAMPRYIDTIRSWSLTRLDPARHELGWTHLWEQEFADESGFRPYMGHPFHWTGVERWFDPEMPGYIVEDEAHYMSPSPTAVLVDLQSLRTES